MNKKFTILSIAGILLGASPLYATNLPEGCANKTTPRTFIYNLLSSSQQAKVLSNFTLSHQRDYSDKMFALSNAVMNDQKAITSIMLSPAPIGSTTPSVELNAAIAKWEKDYGALIEKQSHAVNYMYNNAATPDQKKEIAKNLMLYFNNVNTCHDPNSNIWLTT